MLKFGRAAGPWTPDVKIISKYVLREHVGPLTFALTALTSLMLLNFISRQFGQLVGKGLGWDVIGEFFLLSIPFTVALTVPMSVLVAVLYAFSRLAAENEVIALKASGVSPWRMVTPSIAGGLVWSLGLLAFNDQVLPRANHRLKVLQEDISQTKPTFLFKEQVINPVLEGKFYLKAGKIDRAGETGRMKEVVIYDLSDATRRRTIYADSGRIAMAENRTDMDLELFHGQMQSIATDNPGQLDRLFYGQDRMRFRDVAREFKKSDSEPASKGDREMSVCEMQDRLRMADFAYRAAQDDYADTRAAIRNGMDVRRDTPRRLPKASAAPQPRGIGWVYCTVLRDWFRVKEAQAAELPARSRARQDTVRATRDTAAASDSAARGAADVARARSDSMRRAMLGRALGRGAPLPPLAGAVAAQRGTPGAPFPGEAKPGAPARGSAGGATPLPVVPPAPEPGAQGRQAEPGRTGPLIEPAINMDDARLAEVALRLELATRNRNRYLIEIHKKFSLAAACLIFTILGAPLAVRFPRGGVGLVLGVSLVVFALYYVGLIGGEALANDGRVPPFWAMWGTNVILVLVGLVMLLRMGRDQNTGRGGDWADRIDKVKGWFGRGPRARRWGRA